MLPFVSHETPGGLTSPKLGALCLGVLAACGTPRHTGPVQTTPVAGAAGAVRTLDPPGRSHALHRLTWGERGDRPCYLEAEFRPLADGARVQGATGTRTEVIDVCGGGHGDLVSVSVANFVYTEDDGRVVTVDEPNGLVLYGTGVATCDSKNANDRVKGVRLRGRQVYGTEPDASTYTCTTMHTMSGGEQSLEGPCTPDQLLSSVVQRPNCGTWSAWRACPAGMSAAQLRVHLSGAQDAIVGLQLGCRTVRAERDD